jgi:hypothetical protein
MGFPLSVVWISYLKMAASREISRARNLRAEAPSRVKIAFPAHIITPDGFKVAECPTRPAIIEET